MNEEINNKLANMQEVKLKVGPKRIIWTANQKGVFMPAFTSKIVSKEYLI